MHNTECQTEPYLAGYSICLNRERIACPHVVCFADMALCRHPDHLALQYPQTPGAIPKK